MKPRIFIGSSTESKEIAEAIQSNLEDVAFPEIWDQSLTMLSMSTLSNLMTAISSYDFAIFVFCGEDTAQIRESKNNVVRDNIIFETGLFMGKLGVDHVFFVKPLSLTMHIPSDLLGITYGTFDDNHPNKRAALRTFCNQVKCQINRITILDMPKDGIYGLNLLDESLTIFESGSTSLRENIRYGMYANTLTNQSVVVEISNLSSNKEENVWYYDSSHKEGWLPTTYNGSSQKFVLHPNSRGILDVCFVGTGNASLSVILNGTEIINKNISW